MGTRGLIGFRKNGKDKLTYNHFDSYPTYLGINIIKELKKVKLSELKKAFDNIVLVDNKKRPAKSQIKECIQYSDTHVSEQTNLDWYCLLRKAQGTLLPYFNGLKYMIKSNDFILDSLFCEWAYIVNLDNKTLEIWQGFQQNRTEGNRYGEQPNDGGYYPCKLLIVYDLDNLPKNPKVTMETLEGIENG